MGNQIVSPLVSWWIKYKYQNATVKGPNMGFLLKKNNKYVVVFGEHHKSDLKCSDDEIGVINIFNSLLNSHENKELNILLELAKNTNVNIDKRMTKLLDAWMSKCRDKNCKLEMYKTNLHDLNTMSLTRINYKFGKDNLLNIKKDIQAILKDICQKTDLLHAFFKHSTISDEDRKILENRSCIKDIYSMSFNCYKELEKLNENSDENIIRDKLHCAYDIGLFLIDFYTLLLILSDQKDVIVYEGSFHSVYVVAYLVLFHDYELIDTTSITGINCILFNNNMNIKQDLEKIMSFDFEDDRQNIHIKKNIRLIYHKMFAPK